MNERVSHHKYEEPSSRAPEFDAGVFTISHFATNPDGFTIRTNESLHRRDHPDGGLALSMDQRNELRRGMANEVFFTLPRDFPQDKKLLVQQYFKNIDKLSILKQQGMTRDDPEYSALQALQHALKNELTISDENGNPVSLLRKFALTDRLGLKVGVRNSRLEGNELVIDTRPISYPMYAVAGGPEESRETLDLGAVTGTAAILITSDNKIILQHRSSKNSPYGDMPGASIAGMLDGKLAQKTDPATGKPSQSLGTLQPIDTEYVKESSLTEATQEIGLSKNDFSEYKIVGLARDHVREHDEFLFVAQTELTAQEVARKAGEAPRSRNPRKLDEHGDFHFEENFITIDATPEAIATLLTEVKCPLPPTHAAAFVAAGYNIVLKQSGVEAANNWRNMLQDKIKSNYQQMDQMVVDYYKKNPSELANNKPGKPLRNPKGYEPYYTPQEQGLAPIGPELIRTGLAS